MNEGEGESSRLFLSLDFPRPAFSRNARVVSLAGKNRRFFRRKTLVSSAFYTFFTRDFLSSARLLPPGNVIAVCQTFLAKGESYVWPF